MMAVPFDTLKLARRLQAAGFSPHQADQAAEALAEAMNGSDLATKTDLELLRRDLTIRMSGLVVAGAGVVLAGVRLML